MAHVHDFTHALAELGIHATVAAPWPSAPDVERANALLTRGATRQRYALLVNRPDRLEDVTRLRRVEGPAMLFAAFLPQRTATALRNAGVQYVDSAGNAWIEFGDLLIDIRGRSRPPRSSAPPPRTVAVNLFSAARAKVVFALIAWPELWDAPRRDLAAAAGVSVGLVHDTVTRLRETGLDRDESRSGLPGLLDRWTVAFPGGLAKRLTLASYRGDIESIRHADAGGDVFVSGEAAASQLLRPASAVIYVSEHYPALAVANRWRSDGFANIVVRQSFWRAPREGAAIRPRVGLAPWPLIYADLATSADPRVRDAAGEWKDRFSDAG